MEDTMIVLGRISQLTRGANPVVNWSEDQLQCIEGNIYFRLGCGAPPK
jgi:hypothetical protein